MMTRIPFNRPHVSGREFEYIRTAFEKNLHLSGSGHYTHLCQSFLEEKLGAHKAILTSSCTDALEMAAVLLKDEPGAEVIVPSFTFVSTANAFMLHGYCPVLVDIRPDTLNLDERLLEAAITPRTRAIVPVHYAGVACEMDTISAIAEKHHLTIVEDNAHGLFSTYQGRPLGTLGALASQSFHETKNITCGEGGALLINDERLIERAEIIRDKGTDRSRFFRGQVDKYSWVDVGASYLLSDLSAAFLYAQMEAYEAIQAKRQHIWTRYNTELADWAAVQQVGLPYIPEDRTQSYHMFYILLPNLDARQRLIAGLAALNIAAVFHYTPLHTSGMGQKLGYQAGDCPVTENISDRLLRLPFYNDMTDDEQSRVIEAVRQFAC